MLKNIRVFNFRHCRVLTKISRSMLAVAKFLPLPHAPEAMLQIVYMYHRRHTCSYPYTPTYSIPYLL